MTNTTELSAAEAGGAGSHGSLSSMKLGELKQLATSMGISGTSRMRKGDVLNAIRERGGHAAGTDRQRPARPSTAPGDTPQSGTPQPADQQPVEQPSGGSQPVEQPSGGSQPSEAAAPQHDQPGRSRQDAGQEPRDGRPARATQERSSDEAGRHEQQGNHRGGGDRQRESGNAEQARGDQGQQGGSGRDHGHDGSRRDRRDDNQRRSSNESRSDDGRGDGGGRRRRQRGRDRKRGRGRGGDFGGDVDTQIHDGDVLVPVAGILDVLDNYAFVRTSGYLAGENDVYVSMGMVRKSGLRKGDAITGAVKALREGEQPPARQKFNALVRLDSVNGQPVETAKSRVEFGKLVPLYPQQRLRLETEQNVLTNRVIDLVAPIGKGQRGLIVSPAKAGKTLIMQSIANAITTNNPECHLMVVLVDERPEEVTDMQRAVKGEVIASTFDRPASDHTAVAELSIERAKRLVELGHDVVVLLDSITRLGRAYNLAAPASGRILSGGVDSAALYPPKKFFGAARNIENGGSLTILATALIETGSKMDEVIFEEFKGTGNMELRLSRQLSERRIFPAVDVNASGTRREEILLGHDELKIMWKLRRVLAALDQQQGIELLLDRLKKTKSNVEFLMQVQQTSSIKLDDED